MNLSLDQIEQELAELQAAIEPILARREVLLREKRRLKSMAWINANGVTRDQVQLSSGDGVPWFGHLISYRNWLSANCQKRFCEWNGKVYFTRDIVDGTEDFRVNAMLEHVPEVS